MDGRLRRRHQDQVRKRTVTWEQPLGPNPDIELPIPVAIPVDVTPESTLISLPVVDHASGNSMSASSTTTTTPPTQPIDISAPTPMATLNTESTTVPTPKVYPKRDRNPSDQFEPTWYVNN